MIMNLADEKRIRIAFQWIDYVTSNIYLSCLRLIESSVYWFQRPRNSYVRVPKFAEHMDLGVYGYQLKMGANIFLVEKFLLNALNKIQEILEAKKLDVEYESNTVKYLIQEELKKCVMHENGMIYIEYPVKDGYLMFGVHGISVDESFIHMCYMTGINSIIDVW